MASPVFHSITYGNPKDPVLLFLHGFMGSSLDWKEVASRLSEENYCVCLDLPGHGQTKTNTLEDSHSVESVAEELIRFCQINDIVKPALLGYSMGGRIALQAIHSSPKFFRCVILESASPGLKTAEERERRIESDQLWSERIRTEPAKQFLNDWYNQPVFETLSENMQLREKLIRSRLNDFKAESYAIAISAFSTGRQQSLWLELSEINCPVQLIVGEKDSKFCRIADRMAEELPIVELCITENAGHIVHLEEPKRFVATIRTFLEKHSS